MAAANQLYQISLVSALMDGVCENGTDGANVLRQGDHGLGTVACMEGEVIAVDGQVYQFKADGSAQEVRPEQIIPFAQMTHFAPTLVTEMPHLSKESIAQVVSSLLPQSQNMFVAIRLDGVFARMETRVAKGQAYPGQPLVEVTQNVALNTYADIAGTVFGFRSPPFSSGLSVAGFHLHFISQDRQRGGHILSFDASDVKMGAAVITRVNLELPNTAEFNQVEMKVANPDDIHKAEG